MTTQKTLIDAPFLVENSPVTRKSFLQISHSQFCYLDGSGDDVAERQAGHLPKNYPIRPEPPASIGAGAVGCVVNRLLKPATHLICSCRLFEYEDNLYQAGCANIVTITYSVVTDVLSRKAAVCPRPTTQKRFRAAHFARSPLPWPGFNQEGQMMSP